MSNQIEKLENTLRIIELDANETLKKIGFTEGLTLCDIGAGTGIFSFEAANISSQLIYALEISEEMIQLLESRKKERNVPNIEVRKVESVTLPMESSSCDMALMVTVLHEIEEKITMLQEIKRMLKPGGRVAIIEFHKKESQIGPKASYRLSLEEVEQMGSKEGMKKIKDFSLGENFYCITFDTPR